MAGHLLSMITWMASRRGVMIEKSRAGGGIRGGKASDRDNRKGLSLRGVVGSSGGRRAIATTAYVGWWDQGWEGVRSRQPQGIVATRSGGIEHEW